MGSESGSDHLERVPGPVEFALQPTPGRLRHPRFTHPRAPALPGFEPHGDDGTARYRDAGRRILPYDVVDDGELEFGPVGRDQQHSVRSRVCRLDHAWAAGCGTRICRVVVTRRLPHSRLRSTGGTPIASTPSSALQLHAPHPAHRQTKAPQPEATVIQTTDPGPLARVHGHQADELRDAHFGWVGRYVHRRHPQRYGHGNPGRVPPGSAEWFSASKSHCPYRIPVTGRAGSSAPPAPVSVS
jgi:hypothetical protein